MSSINWGSLMKTANESDMEPLKPTSGHFKVIKCEAKKSAKGKDGLFTRLQSLEGETKGKAFNNTFWISPENANAMWMFFKQMEAFGLTRDGFFAGNPSLDKTAKTMTNRVVWMKVTDDREWQGRKQNEIAEIAAPKNASYTNPGVAGPSAVTEMEDWDDDPLPEAAVADDPAPQAVATEEDMTADDDTTDENSTEFGDSVPAAPPAPF